MCDPTADVLNVMDFGAKGDGLHDDTQAIEDAINASLEANTDPTTTHRKAQRPVYIPRTHRITRGLKFWATEGPHFFGNGRSISRLIVDAPGIDTVIDVNSCGRGVWKDFTIKATSFANSFNVGIKYYSVGAAGVSTQCSFERLMLHESKFKHGIVVGNLEGIGAQEDQTQWRDIIVAGQNNADVADPDYWQNGIVVGSSIFSNNCIHSFWGITSAHFRNGIKCAAGQALFEGGCVQNNAVDWELTSATSYWTVRGFRSEESGRFIQNLGGYHAAVNATFSDCQWRISPSLHTDRRVIDWNVNGCLQLNNNTITGYEAVTPAPKPRLHFQGALGGTLGFMDVRGLVIGGGATLDDWLETTQPDRVSAKMITVLGTDGAPIATQF